MWAPDPPLVFIDSSHFAEDAGGDTHSAHSSSPQSQDGHSTIFIIEDTSTINLPHSGHFILPHLCMDIRQ